MAELLINYSVSPDPVSGAAQQRDYHTLEHCTLGTTTSSHRVSIRKLFALSPWSVVPCSVFPSRLVTAKQLSTNIREVSQLQRRPL